MSDLKSNNNINDEPVEQPKKCSMCLEFFGSKAFDYLCSKCYKIRSQSIVQEKPVKSPVKVETRSTLPQVQEQTKVEVKSETDVKTEPEKPKQADTSKCFSCSKKVGILGYTCKCGFTYCKNHRLPEDHECSFDFKAAGKDKLSKDNPSVVAAKLEKI